MKGLAIDVEARIGELSLAVSLETRGEPLVLVGPNGAGKTSLILLVLGAIRPTRGRIELGGEPLFDSTRSIDLPPEDRRLGYMPQHYGLFPHMTAGDNVRFALDCRNHISRDDRRRRVAELLAAFDAAHLETRLPSSLSGGEAQRVALARALASEPSALLLDEPLAALDVSVRRQLRDFLKRRLAELRLPTLVVTHDVADAAALSDDIAVAERGRIVQRGSLAELRAKPATDFVREWLVTAP